MNPRSLVRQEALDGATERRLARAARAGDTAARDRLVRASTRLVALRVVALGFDGQRLDDAFQDGVEGLLRAVDRFDPGRGASLATYAWPWITGAILTGARRDANASATIREPFDSEKPPDDSALAIDVDQALAELPEQQAAVVRLRFGLDGRDGVPQSRRSVALALGLTVGAVRRVEDQAVRQLRRRLATVGDRASPSGEADPL